MIKCSYCDKELDRKVYCSTAHRVADFRRSKNPQNPIKPILKVDAPQIKTLPSVDNTLSDKEKLWMEYPELRPKVVRPI